MSQVTVYSTSRCPYCVRAKRLLEHKRVPYEEINLDGDHPGRMALVRRAGGARTVPQIWVGAVHVGGFDELNALERRGRLDGLLQQQGISVR